MRELGFSKDATALPPGAPDQATLGMKSMFRWIGGATWILEAGGIKIACDPVLCTRDQAQDYRWFTTRRLDDPLYFRSDFADVDLWLLTHGHQDHIDAPGLDVMRREAPVVCHRSCAPSLSEYGFADVRPLKAQETSLVYIRDVTVTVAAVPAFHASRRVFAGIVGKGNGYRVEIARGEQRFTFYVTGDTVFKTRDARNGLSLLGLDLIVANAGSARVGRSLLSAVVGRITNNARDLKRMSRILLPKTLIPVHWGTFSHYRERLTPNMFVKDTPVKVLMPGDTIKLS